MKNLKKIIHEEIQQALLEDSRGNIMRSLGLPRYVAEYFYNISSSGSYILAHFWKELQELKINRGEVNTALQYWRNLQKENKKKLNNYLSKELSENDRSSRLSVLEIIFDDGLKYFTNNPRSGKPIVDYVLNDPHSGRALKKLLYSDAWNYAKEKNLVLQAKKASEQDSILSFENGYHWVRLDADGCDYEASEMQHCGEDQRGIMYSLRDSNYKPHVTATVGEYDDVGYQDVDSEVLLYQVKGKQNDVPHMRYWKYILEFVIHMKIETLADYELREKAPRLAAKIEAEISKNKFRSYRSEDPEKKELVDDVMNLLEELSREEEIEVAYTQRNSQKKNQILSHNVKALTESGDIFEFFGLNAHDVVEMVGEISVLHVSRIVEKLGDGFFGVVYGLDNGHALKIYKESPYTMGPDALGNEAEVDKTEIDWYNEMQRLAFSGNATLQNLMIHEHGEVLEGKNKLFYVEMSKVETLKGVLGVSDSTIADRALVILRKILGELDSTASNKEEVVDNFKHFLLAHPNISKTVFEFARSHPVVFRSVVRAMIKHKLTGYEIFDIKTANIGVLQQNPNVVVIFDF